MKNVWFKRVGWIYLPVSLPAAIITLAALAFCAQVFLAVDHKSHAASDTFYGVFPFLPAPFYCLIGSPAQRARIPELTGSICSPT